MNRRELLGLGVKLGVLASTTVLPIQEALAASPSRYAAAFALLDRYVEQYLRDMNAPGLTLALADDSGIQRVCAYGMEDLERRIPLNPDRLFPSLFEPVHGSAPDIAGKNIANPIGQIWCGAMMLEFLGCKPAHDAVLAAIEKVLAPQSGAPRTADIGGSANTQDVGKAIAAAL